VYRHIVPTIVRDLISLDTTGWVTPEDGDRIQSPKRRVLNKGQDD
jgi:hypothetical protein